MSVNAINTAEPVNAGQKKSNNVGLIAGTTAGLGLAGAGGGLLWGGTKLTPEQILALSTDTFEARTKDLEGDTKTAADKVKTEIEKLNGDSNLQVDEKVKKEFEQAIDQVNFDNDMPQEIKDEKSAQTAYDNKVKEKAAELKTQTPTLSEEDATRQAKEALMESDEAKALKAAKEKARPVREAKLRTLQDEKGIVEAYDNAVKKAAEAKTNKINELVNQDEIKTALGKIKKFFREGQNKAAWLYGGIAAAAGLIIGMVISSNNKKNA